MTAHGRVGGERGWGGGGERGDLIWFLNKPSTSRRDLRRQEERGPPLDQQQLLFRAADEKARGGMHSQTDFSSASQKADGLGLQPSLAFGKQMIDAKVYALKFQNSMTHSWRK